MTTQMRLLNFRSIAKATLYLDRDITLIAAWNEEGKTSIAYALRALLCTASWPITGKPAIDGPLLCAEGQEMGAARLITDAGQMTMTWPEGGQNFDPENAAPHMPSSSVFAAGIQQFVSEVPTNTEERRRRLEAFQRIFKANPSHEDLSEALKTAEIQDRSGEGDEPYQDIWNLVDAQGWDPAWKKAKKNDTEMQGRWCQVTGRQKWGKKIAEDWKAEPPADPMAETELPDLDALTKDAEAQAVAVDEAHKALAAVPEPPTQANPVLCPHCQKGIRWENGAAFKHVEVSEAKLKEVRMKRVDLQGDLKCARETYEAAMAAFSDAKALHLQAEEKEDESAEVTSRAAKINQEILRWQTIAGILGPGGVREDILRQRLGAVNETLHKSSMAIGLSKGVRFGTGDDDMLEVYLGDRHYLGLCGAEKWRVRALLQIHIAKLDGSAYVVLDEASTMVKATDRTALMRCIKQAGVKAVVMMAVAKPEQVPDLGATATEIGRTYWVQNGKVMPLAEAIELEKAA